MKRILLSIFLLVSLFSCNSSSDQINGIWLAVESRHYGNSNWISPMDGYIFDISNDSMTIGNIYTDSTITVHLSQTNENLIVTLADEIDSLKIHHIDQDSLTILIDSDMLVKFIPLSPAGKMELKEEHLTAFDWEYGVGDNFNRVHFQDESLYAGFPPICIIGSHEEMYRLYTYRNIHLLLITEGQTNLRIHHFQENNGDTLITKLYTSNGYTEPKLIKQESLPSAEIEKIKSQLKGTWITSHLMGYGSEKGLHGDSSEFITRGNSFLDNSSHKISLDKETLLANDLSFSFDDDTYEFKANESVFNAGNYRLSHDGTYIILNDGANASDYVHILAQEDGELIVQKFDEFAVNNSGEWVKYLYQLKLIRRETSTGSDSL